jgi:hypothetical protein
MENSKKSGFLVQDWHGFCYGIFFWGGGMDLFLRCDQIQEFLGMGGDEETSVAPPTPMAEGGAVSFIPVEGNTYEVHVFTTSGVLSFKDSTTANITADYLIVGGGGGSGGKSSGGGAGVDGVNYGDGGSASNMDGAAGRAGHIGIVIIRLPHTK